MKIKQNRAEYEEKNKEAVRPYMGPNLERKEIYAFLSFASETYQSLPR